jgi:hypothetical protein
MQTIRAAAGSAAWFCQVTKDVNLLPAQTELERVLPRCEQKTIQTLIGEIPIEDLDRGVDIDAFVEGVWARLKCNGDMALKLIMSDGLVVDIESTCDLDEVEIHSVMYDFHKYPAGLCGRWIV